MLTISTESYLGRSIRFNQLPTFIATSAVEYFRTDSLSSAKNLSPTELCSILTAKTTAAASSEHSSITVDTFSGHSRLMVTEHDLWRVDPWPEALPLHRA